MDSRKQFEGWAEQFLRDYLTWKESGPGELAWRAWQAGRASMRDEAFMACINEHLQDPQDKQDEAYDAAVEHCSVAVSKIVP